MAEHRLPLSLIPLALALNSAVAVGANISIGNVSLETNGAIDVASDHFVWEEVNPGVLTNTGQRNPPYAVFLDDNASAPSSNIELSTIDSAAEYNAWLADLVDPTVLTGDFGGSNPVTFSSLTIGDWTDGGDALAKEYVAGFLDTWLGITLDPVDLAIAAAAFIVGAPGIPSPAASASDPNLSYAYRNTDNGALTFATAGLLDATSFLQPFFDLLPGSPQLPAGVQASEVIQVSYRGTTDYYYGFSATPSGVYAEDCPDPGSPSCSYTGNFEFTIPEPATVAILGAGIAGLGFARRRAVKA
jgi:hypothetical protein